MAGDSQEELSEVEDLLDEGGETAEELEADDEAGDMMETTDAVVNDMNIEPPDSDAENIEQDADGVLDAKAVSELKADAYNAEAVFANEVAIAEAVDNAPADEDAPQAIGLEDDVLRRKRTWENWTHDQNVAFLQSAAMVSLMFVSSIERCSMSRHRRTVPVPHVSHVYCFMPIYST